MSKALVITGANFIENKIETITIIDEIPCTDISLSESEATIQTVGGTETLLATVTPVNTTDEIVWSSSNENVATVNNGVITTVGVGEAIITVSCGEQSATCDVISKHIIDAEDLVKMVGYGILTSQNDYVAMGSGYPKYRAYAMQQNALNGYKAYGMADSSYPDGTPLYPIPLPNGATKLTFTFPSAFSNLAYGLTRATEASSYFSGASAKTVQNNATQSVSGGTFTLVITDTDADSFVFGMNVGSGSAEDVTGDVIITVE